MNGSDKQDTIDLFSLSKEERADLGTQYEEQRLSQENGDAAGGNQDLLSFFKGTVEKEPETGTPDPTQTEEQTEDTPKEPGLQKKLEHKELMLQRQGTEIGQLRKAVAKLTEFLGLDEGSTLTPEFLQRDPEGFFRAYEEQKSQKTEQSEGQLQEFESHNQEFVDTNIVKTEGGFKALVPDIVEMLRADGVPEDRIKVFHERPFAHQTDILVHLAKRAQLMRENKELRTRTEELSQRLGNFPKKLIEARQASPVVRPSTGQTSVREKPFDPFAMTSEERKAWLEDNKELSPFYGQ